MVNIYEASLGQFNNLEHCGRDSSGRVEIWCQNSSHGDRLIKAVNMSCEAAVTQTLIITLYDTFGMLAWQICMLCISSVPSKNISGSIQFMLNWQRLWNNVVLPQKRLAVSIHVATSRKSYACQNDFSGIKLLNKSSQVKCLTSIFCVKL